MRVAQEINVLALVKGGERYIFLYDDAHRAEVLRQFGKFAADPELSFTWYDAAVLSQKVRQQSPGLQPHPRLNLALPTEPDEL